jgi:hypothetical protein
MLDPSTNDSATVFRVCFIQSVIVIVVLLRADQSVRPGGKGMKGFLLGLIFGLAFPSACSPISPPVSLRLPLRQLQCRWSECWPSWRCTPALAEKCRRARQSLRMNRIMRLEHRSIELRRLPWSPRTAREQYFQRNVPARSAVVQAWGNRRSSRRDLLESSEWNSAYRDAGI